MFTRRIPQLFKKFFSTSAQRAAWCESKALLLPTTFVTFHWFFMKHAGHKRAQRDPCTSFLQPCLLHFLWTFSWLPRSLPTTDAFFLKQAVQNRARSEAASFLQPCRLHFFFPFFNRTKDGSPIFWSRELRGPPLCIRAALS